MQINLTNLGFLPNDCPKVFFRVEDWNSGRRVADFTTHGEAAHFAIADARAKGLKYDHKVCTMQLVRD